MIFRGLFFGLLIVFSVLFAMPNNVSALSDCSDAEVVFARGSGQSVNQGGSESVRFIESLIGDAKKVDINISSHELTELEYPAVPVANNYSNALGAWASGGEAFDYGKSVDTGAKSLKSYLENRHTECPNTDFILGGYSQGAQVVGEALHMLKDSNVKDRIVFNALFGDPKLFLPEGMSRGVDINLTPYPSLACMGFNLSDWRRDPINCQTYSGILSGRTNYLPEFAKKNTGLWCQRGDLICNGFGNTDEHGRYKEEDGAIDKAVTEALSRLSGKVPDQNKLILESILKFRRAGNINTDVAFVLDISGSMTGRIYNFKNYIKKYANKVQSIKGRVALTVFKNYCDSQPAEVLLDLTPDISKLSQVLDGVTANGGCDPGEGSYHALTKTLNTLKWRDGAAKAAILITDEPPANPDRTDGSTAGSIAKRALEIDPVNIYPIVSSSLRSSFQELANLTSGEIIDDSNAETAFDTVVDKLKRRPMPTLPMVQYKAMKDELIRFDASNTWVDDGDKINLYEWDFNGDGVIDQTTDQAVVEHAYPSEFNGFMSVRVRAESGTIASASAEVIIYGDVSQLPKLPTHAEDVRYTVDYSNKSVNITWNQGTSTARYWQIYVNDYLIGRADAVSSDITTTIGDMQLDKDVSISIVGRSEEGLASDPVDILIKPESQNGTDSCSKKKCHARPNKVCVINNGYFVRQNLAQYDKDKFLSCARYKYK